MLKLLHLCLLVVLQPADGLVNSLLEGLLVAAAELCVSDGVPHVVGVVLQTVLGLNLLLELLVVSLVLLSLLDHALNLILGETSLIVGDGDLVLDGGGLVLSRDVEDTVGVNVKDDVDLGDSARGRGDARELELSELVVVLGACTLSLKDLDEDSRLVVRVGGEDLLLLGGDGGVTGDKDSHDTSSSLETEGERGDIEEEEVLDLLASLASEDGGLDGSTIGNSLIRVDALVELLAVEKVLEERLDLGDTSGSSDKDNLVDEGLVHLSVAEALLNRLHALAEEVHVELLETSPGDRSGEVHTLEQRVELNGGLGGGGEGTLCALASSTEPEGKEEEVGQRSDQG